MTRRSQTWIVLHQTPNDSPRGFRRGWRLAPYANKNQAVLVRYVENDKRQMIKLDLSQPDTLEIEIKDRDVLIAESSAFGKLVHGMGFYIGLPGLGGIGYRDPARYTIKSESFIHILMLSKK